MSFTHVSDCRTRTDDNGSHTPTLCPTCRGQNTEKFVQSLLTEIHLCRDCHWTFVVQRPTRSVSFPPSSGR